MMYDEMMYGELMYGEMMHGGIFLSYFFYFFSDIFEFIVIIVSF